MTHLLEKKFNVEHVENILGEHTDIDDSVSTNESVVDQIYLTKPLVREFLDDKLLLRQLDRMISIKRSILLRILQHIELLRIKIEKCILTPLSMMGVEMRLISQIPMVLIIPILFLVIILFAVC